MKKTKRHQVDEQEIIRFNLFRENVKTKEFSQKEMREELHKKLGYSIATRMLRALCSGVNPPIIKMRRGVYCVNSKPVHIERLQTAWNEYSLQNCDERCQNDSKLQCFTEEQAIELLKSKGYKIYKQVTKYEEI